MQEKTQKPEQKTIVATRSRFEPILFLILGAALSCGSVWYAISLRAGAEGETKKLIVAMLCVFSLLAVIFFFFSARGFLKPREAVSATEEGITLHFNRSEKNDVFIPYPQIRDCRYRSFFSPFMNFSPFTKLTYGTLYFYTAQKTYAVHNVQNAKEVCLDVRATLAPENNA